MLVSMTFGCVLAPHTEPLSAEEQQVIDLEAYAVLVAELEANAVEVLDPGASDLVADGGNLFFLDYNDQWDPTVYVVGPDDTEATALTVLSFDDLNWRVSEQMLQTARIRGDQVDYEAYNLDGDLIGTTTVPRPQGAGVSWWAHAVDGDRGYFVDESSEALYRFSPGGPPRLETAFADLGVDLQVFWDFDIDGDELLFVESGRLWLADLAASKATFLDNETEVSGAATFDAGVAYTASAGIFVVEPDSLVTLDLSAHLEAHPFELSKTLASSHLPGSDGRFSVLGSTLIYIAYDGVYAYDVATDHVEPILLQPRDPERRIDYRNPVVTSDGLLYVVALTSTSGAVGVEGPVLRVRHPYLVR